MRGAERRHGGIAEDGLPAGPTLWRRTGFGRPASCSQRRTWTAKHDKVNVKVMIMSHSADVQTMVLNALHWDLAVPRHRLKVEFEDGWVTMSGVVDRPYQRTCAESDARKVPGVVGVINQIRLAPDAGGAQRAVGH